MLQAFIVTLREGDVHSGYRIATVERDRVLFERDGSVVPVVVGRPHSGPKGSAEAPARPRFFFVPGPDKPTPDLEYTGPQRHSPPESGVAALVPPAEIRS